jgi:hypothetical protein
MGLFLVSRCRRYSLAVGANRTLEVTAIRALEVTAIRTLEVTAIRLHCPSTLGADPTRIARA